MAIYEYPQVPRQQRAVQPQPPATPAGESTQVDNRFSFLPTPLESRGLSLGRQTIHSGQTEVPSLPQLPEHLNLSHQTYGLNSAQPASDSLVAQHEPVQDLPHHPAPAYSHYSKQPPGQYQTDPKSEATSFGPVDSSTSCSTSISNHTPESHQQKPTLHSIRTGNMHFTQMQAQVEKPGHQQTRGVIGPDANPLSPTTPTKTHAPAQHKTTNMAILAPPEPNTFQTINFSPLPQPERGGTWHHSIFSCAEPTICLTSLLCPCIIYGRTQSRLTKRSEKQDPTNMLDFNSCNGSCMVFGVLCGFNAILATIQKTRVRKAYGMDPAEAGNVLDDCWKGFCCCCCSVAQDEKEMKWREEEARQVGGKEGYVPVGGMSFQAPPR